MCHYACVSGRAWFVVMNADVKRRMARVPETDTDSVISVFVDVVQVPEPSVRGEEGLLLGQVRVMRSIVPGACQGPAGSARVRLAKISSACHRSKC